MRHDGHALVSVVLPVASRLAWQAFCYQYNLLISGYRLRYLQLIVVLTLAGIFKRNTGGAKFFLTSNLHWVRFSNLPKIFREEDKYKCWISFHRVAAI